MIILFDYIFLLFFKLYFIKILFLLLIIIIFQYNNLIILNLKNIYNFMNIKII